MSSAHWGYDGSEAGDDRRQRQVAWQQQQEQQQQQMAHLPAALLSTLKREKKPFTYTPGGVNLSEVLEARLQKRIERKQRYREERPRQVVVANTYNTPLELYSPQNALEVLELQAGLGDGSSSFPARSATLPRNHTFRFEDAAPDRGVAQSKAFRVLQIMTDTEEDAAEEGCGPWHRREETRFGGLRDSGSIPSRFFQTLQKITGTERTDDGPRPEPTDGRVAEPSPGPIFPPAAASSGYLRRPAAFLPSKASPAPGFRPVRPALGHRAPVSGTSDF